MKTKKAKHKKIENDSKKKVSCIVHFLPLIRFRMMSHATSAVFATSNPIPINVIPTTRSRGSVSSSFSLGSAHTGSTLKFVKIYKMKIFCAKL